MEFVHKEIFMYICIVIKTKRYGKRNKNATWLQRLTQLKLLSKMYEHTFKNAGNQMSKAEDG